VLDMLEHEMAILVGFECEEEAGLSLQMPRVVL